MRCPDAQQLSVEALARQRVERAERLVEQEHARLQRQRAGDGHALAHAARQLVRAGAGEPAEADEVEQLGGARRRRSARGQPASAQGEGDVVERVAPGQQPRFLEDEADPRIGPDHGLARRPHGAAGRAEQAADDAQQRALAAAVGADEGRDLRGRTAKDTPSSASSGGAPAKLKLRASRAGEWRRR